MTYHYHNFTSHYVSINSNNPACITVLELFFTSHYVSINSNMQQCLHCVPVYFTSHYVSINSWYDVNVFIWCCSLHPTMYLLILHPDPYFRCLLCPLHPTMYLLIHDPQLPPVFRNVTLHPTMYLLIQNTLTFIVPIIFFTSHYVSINSRNY